jgi:phosphinothricin acetyltransferase
VIRPVREEDARVISEIYNYYILHSPATFEEEPLSPGEMAGRIGKIRAAYPFIVWEGEGGPEGYAYLSRWKERASYRYSAELSIYRRRGREGRGIGSALMARLLEEARKGPLHALVSGITLPNERSAALHEKFGFKQIARFSEIGFKDGAWYDVGYWQLLLKKDGP